jgi:hypothetical protein
MGGSRERAGKRLTLVGAVLGLVAAAGLGVLFLVGGTFPVTGAGELSLPLLWAMPAFLALLSLRERPVLLLPAAVLGFPLAFTVISWLILVLLVPAICYGVAYDLRRSRPSTGSRSLLAVVLPVLAGAGAFVALLVGTDSICFNHRENDTGERTYREVPCLEDGDRVDPVVADGPDDRAAGAIGSTSTVTPAAAAASAGLIATGLASGWTASGSGGRNDALPAGSDHQNGPVRDRR